MRPMVWAISRLVLLTKIALMPLLLRLRVSLLFLKLVRFMKVLFALLLVIISEKEIFNRIDSDNQYKTKFKIGTKIRNISKLNVGDFVVHQVHGIGRY